MVSFKAKLANRWHDTAFQSYFDFLRFQTEIYVTLFFSGLIHCVLIWAILDFVIDAHEIISELIRTGINITLFIRTSSHKILFLPSKFDFELSRLYCEFQQFFEKKMIFDE